MGRSRTGTSAINRRKFVAKASTSSTSQPASQPANKIVPASTSINAAGLVVAAPGAADRVQGKRPVSTTIAGGEIKVDDEGRMSLDEIEKKHFLEQLFRGSIVPTEQMVGVAKDVAYGVSSEDQRTMESGLDLLLNPLIKPYVDPRMKTEEVISEEWYFPEELKSDWNVLPGFMQKSDTIEKRSFIDGVSANVGNIGAISQSELGHQIRDEEFAVSGERFERAPGYYIGSALGEIPYFIIGAGQVKAVGTIAAKATAGAARGGLKGTTGAKVIAVAYKIERATDKLQKVSNLANAGKDLTKVITRPEVLKAVDLLKKGYTKNTAVQKKGIEKNQKLIDDPSIDSIKKIELEEINKKLTNNIQKNDLNYSRIDKKFGKTEINKLDNMKTGTKDSINNKALKIDEFNTQVQIDLLPEMRKFKDGYLAHATDIARNSKTEKFAQLIEGSPSNANNKIDQFFNRRAKELGDSDIEEIDLLNLEKATFKKRVYEGEFAGVMGKIKLDNTLYGNVLKTSLGINRAQGKLKGYASVISKTFPTLRVINREQFLKVDQNLVDERTSLSNYNKLIKNEKTSTKDLSSVKKKLILENENKIRIIDETLDTNKKTKLQLIAHTSKRGKGKDHSNTDVEYIYDYNVLQQVYPSLAENVIPKKILFGARPSVNIEKRHGIIMGTIGDALSGTKETIGGKTFWFTDMARKEGIETFGEVNLSKNPSWTKKIGLKKVRKYKTLIPTRVQAKEKILHWFEATDDLLVSSGIKSGVRPVVFLNKGTNLTDLYVFKKQHHLRDFTGDKSVRDTFGKDKIILEYDDISMDEIKKIQPKIKTEKGKTVETYGDAEQINGLDLHIILKNRATLENRPDMAKQFIDIEINKLEAPIKNAHTQYTSKKLKIKKSNAFHNEKNRAKALEKNNLLWDSEIKKLNKIRNKKITQIEAKQEDIRDITIRVQAYSTSNPRGTVTSTPWANVLKQKRLLEQKYESDQIVDITTGKKYYIAGKKWYEVTDKSFNPSMITKFDSVKQQRSERVFIPGEKYFDEKTGKWKGDFYDEDILKTDSTMGLKEIAEKQYEDKISKGTIIPKDDTTTKTSMGYSGQPMISKSVLGDIDKLASENKIFLNKDPEKEILRGMLKPVSDADKDILLSGSTIGGAIAKRKAVIKDVDQANPTLIKTSDPEIEFLAKKTGKELLKQNVAITLGKFQVGKLSSMSDVKNKLSELLIGKKFAFVETRNFAPDPSITQRSGSMLGSISKGDSVFISGVDDPWRRMIMSTQTSQVTQPGIPGGVKVVPIYDSTTVAHIIDESISNRFEKHLGKGLQSNKGTNYEQLMEIAVRQQNVPAFKERMIDLVYTKIKKEGKPTEPIKKQLMEEDSSLYQKEIIDEVSTPNNELLRDLSWIEKRSLSRKNKKTGEKKSVISPKEDFVNVLEDVNIDTRNPFKRLIDARRFRSVGTESEYFKDQTQPFTQLTKPDGSKIAPRDILDQILWSVQQRKNKKTRIKIENISPYMRVAMKEIMNDPLLSSLISKNKKWKGVKEVIKSIGETDTDRSLKVLLKGEQEIKTRPVKTMKKLGSWNEGTDGEKIYRYSVKDMKTGKSIIVKDKQKATRLVYQAGNMPDTIMFTGRAKGGKKNKRYEWEQLKTPFKSDDNKTVNPRGAPTDTEPTKFLGSRAEVKDTLDQTVAILRLSIYRDLGLSLDSTTSLGRSKLGKSLSESMTKIFRQEQTKSGSGTIKTLEEFLESDTASKVINTKGFMDRMNKWETQINIMKDVPDKTVEKMSDTPREVNAFTSQQIMDKVTKSQKRDNSVGIRQQFSGLLSPTSTVTSNISTRTGLLQQPAEQQTEGFSLFPSIGEVSAEPFIVPPQPKNIIDQTIGDIQKTMSGITSGTEGIGEAKRGVDIKTYEMSQSLNIFDTSNIQSQNQQPSLIEGLNLGLREEYSTVVVPKFESMLGTVIDTVQKQRVKPVSRFLMGGQIGDNQLRAIPPLLKPKPIPQRVMPLVPVFPLYNPDDPRQRSRRKYGKSKKKKTWWQTPENWYEPYYWGGKDQMGQGYVTFTGKEPGKVKKYEKKFFGIGVNDSPFGVRSKWF